jgi:hypothetical protein
LSEFWLKVDKTLRHHGRAAVRALRGVWWDLVRPPAIRPVIVIGCSRAGTTLVYKTFSESRELGTLQRETHDFWMELHHPREQGWDTHALDARHASASDRDFVTRYFYAWTGRSRWVDKNNQNGLCVPYLAALFPDAHFVFVKRSPGDNLNSLIEGWGKPEEFATWSAALPEPVAIDGGRYTRWCFFLAEGWRAYTRATIEEVCAFQYVAINSAILEAKAAVPPRSGRRSSTRIWCAIRWGNSGGSSPRRTLPSPPPWKTTARTCSPPPTMPFPKSASTSGRMAATGNASNGSWTGWSRWRAAWGMPCEMA